MVYKLRILPKTLALSFLTSKNPFDEVEDNGSNAKTGWDRVKLMYSKTGYGISPQLDLVSQCINFAGNFR